MAVVSEKVLRAVFEQSYNSIVVTSGSFDDDGPLILFANPAFCRMTGYTEEELVGKNARILQGPETDRGVIDSLKKALEAGIFWEGETINYRKDGRRYYVRWNISPVRGEAGTIDYFVSVQSDVSAEVEARRDRRLFAGALDVATDAIVVLDSDTRIVVANQTLSRLSGHDPDELVGEPLIDALFPDADPSEGAAWLRRLQQGDTVREVVELRTTTGEMKFVEVRISAVPGPWGGATNYVLLGSDVTERVEAERELRDQAQRDELTGLLNRRGSGDVLERVASSASDRRRSFVAIMTDIDHFKKVNDTHGHAVGDRILVAFAKTLQRTVRDEDTVVRWGGEEFLVLLEDASLEVGRDLAERLRSEVHGIEDADAGTITASFGVTVAKPGDTPETLLERADQALYAAKDAGRDRVVVAEDGEA